ncbi:hypothetical protein [Paenibacillus antibioticophila]|uniref:hypothetical protein n=1 Tax=Paenibacillus antibioticophila TaxID=1274374 RepID=UPI0005CB1FC1|nr:hypothetical protein [Paenibacillus antibioticophila]
MAKTDWRFTDTVIPEDLNGIGEEINGLRTELSTRFDHEATTPLTLQPGLQVVHAEKDSRFKLGEIRGRTLVNLLGVAGGCENLGEWNLAGNQLPTLDTAKKKYGSSSISLVRSFPPVDSYIYRVVKLKPGAKYVAIQEINIASTTGDQGALLSIQQPSLGEVITNKSADMSKLNVWQPVFAKFTGDSAIDNTINIVAIVGWGTNGDISVNVDGIRLYEISEAEYSALDNMTAEEVGMKYPFVSLGIVGVQSPYVIDTSGNLLPPFYKWDELGNLVSITEPYSALLAPSASVAIFYVNVPVIQGQTYTLDMGESTGFAAYILRDSAGNALYDSGLISGTKTFTVSTEGASYLQMIFGNGGPSSETLTFENPMLSIGAEPQPFVPQRKSMLAFQTELHANPTDGSDPDILFEQNGEYKKLAKWRKVVLDGSLSWEIHSTGTGFKQLRVNRLSPNYVGGSKIVTKFNGDRLSNTTVGMTLPDYVYNHPTDSTDNLYISVSSANSGWGDDYTPTQDEIRAYFNGWRMAANDNWGLPYPGTGVKAWGRINSTGGLVPGSGTTVLPTALNTEGGYTPYQLLYRLAKETVEPVVTEGALTLSEGDNMVEVGTGIVLRERANPYYHAPQNRYYINNLNFGTSLLYFKSSSIIAVYKDSTDDATWHVDATPGGGANLVQAYVDTWNYDQAAAYSVTYIKLDTSPIQPLVGTLAANEKAQISDLTAGVTEALQRVSVVEQKKAEKDAPGWITPTLLNGWVSHSANFPKAQYYKDSNGVVCIRGFVKDGTTSGVLFVLPEGYRPDLWLAWPVTSYDGTNVAPGTVNIKSNGEIQIAVNVKNTWLSLEGISFLANNKGGIT